jgi:hypothetical protein
MNIYFCQYVVKLFLTHISLNSPQANTHNRAYTSILICLLSFEILKAAEGTGNLQPKKLHFWKIGV